MNRYMSSSEITNLNIDINNICNAACPGCARQIGYDIENPHYGANKSMNMDTWKKLFTEVGMHVDNVVFCGNYGDAAATRELPDMLRWAHSINSNTKFIVVSNMGLGTESFWIELAKCVPHRNLRIQSSIDGLKDTNHIYRRFVKWDIVLRNVRAVISAGAHAEWKFIEFPWNSHKIEQARTRSINLGFKSFRVTPNNNPRSGERILREYENKKDIWNNRKYFNLGTASSSSFADIDEAYEFYKSRRTPWTSIECYTKNEKSIHVDWNGSVWPCCWIGGSAYHPKKWYTEILKSYIDDEDNNWNNINYHTVGEILNHSFYRERLMNSIQSDKPYIACIESCGKNNDSWNCINTIGKQ